MFVETFRALIWVGGEQSLVGDYRGLLHNRWRYTGAGFSQRRRIHGNGEGDAGRSSAIQRELGCGHALLPCLQSLARVQADLFQEHRVQEAFCRRGPKAASRVPISLQEIDTHCRTMGATYGESTCDRANSCCSR